MKKHKLCRSCGLPMRRHGKTSSGRQRYLCLVCGHTSIIHRDDTEDRHIEARFISWLTGKETLSDIGGQHGMTRQGVWKQFHPFFHKEIPSPSPDCSPRILIVDGTYVHGRSLCVLIAVDEHDHIFWKFVKSETYLAWASFLETLPEPDVVVGDGQKGLFAAVSALFEDAAFQRCQFHVIQLVHKYLTRDPDKEEAGEFLDILYRLKDAKTREKATLWKIEYKHWEARHEQLLKEKTPGGRYRHARLRSARTALRSAWPHLFTFLDHENCPNTTNLVEGWTNAALAGALREHRGLHLWQKKALVSVILKNLSRPKL